MKKNLGSDPTKTILIITVGMLVVYMLTEYQWALYTAVSIGLVGILSNYLAKKIDFLWMKLTWLLSLIVPNILLSIIFYLFLTPIAIASKLFGNKNKVSVKNTDNSLFIEVNKSFDKSSFEKSW